MISSFLGGLFRVNRSSDKTIFLHAGISKTGTTAIQKYFHTNSEALRRRGLHYLVAGRAELGESHHWLAKMYKQDEVTDALRSDLLSEIAQSDCKSFVISSELFEYFGLEQIRKFKNDLYPHKLVLVLYLRYQDQALSSMYNELVKKHACSVSFSEHVGVTPRKRLLQYSRLVEPWEAALGRKNVRVRIFDRERLVGGNVVSDLLSVVGCTSVPAEIPLSAANKSVSSVAIRALTLINSHMSYKVDHAVHYGEACRLALRLDELVRRKFPYLEHDSNSYFTSREEYEDFLAYYRADNVQLSRRYLSGQMMVPSSYQPAPALSDDQLGEILTALALDLGIIGTGATATTSEVARKIADFWSGRLRTSCEKIPV